MTDNVVRTRASMGPPIESFPTSELAVRVNMLPNGRRRKGGGIEISRGELLELVQYSCHLKGNIIQCEPVVKLFRR